MGEEGPGDAYPTYDIFMVSEVCFAVLAPVDAVAVEIRVVCETHGCFFASAGECPELG
jgi:hypothetical protein